LQPDKSHLPLTDSNDLAKLGYRQELFRALGGFSNFAVSFSIISVATCLPQLFGYGLQHGGPLQMSLGWILVSLFTLSVGLAMAELASAYPTAGALYHWSTIFGGRGFGWVTAGFNLIGGLAGIAAIDYGLAQFLVPIFDLPNTHATAFGLFLVFLVSQAALNDLGIKLVGRLNNLAASYNMVVVIFLFGLLVVKGFVQPVSFLFHFYHTDGYSPGYSFLIGILPAAWTLVGYDASAHLCEETINPRKNVPHSIFLAIAVSIVFGFLLNASVTAAISDLPAAAQAGDSAFFEIIKARLGGSSGTFLVCLIAGAMWLCGLAGMTAGSRMVYAFARDNGLPFSNIWSQVNQKRKTPSRAIWGIVFFASALALSASVYSAVVSVAVVALNIAYGLPIAARLRFRFRNKNKDIVGPWTLVGFSSIVSAIAVLWVVFITVVLVIPPNEQAGFVLGGCVAGLVCVWQVFAKKKFVGPKIEAQLVSHLRLKENRISKAG